MPEAHMEDHRHNAADSRTMPHCLWFMQVEVYSSRGRKSLGLEFILLGWMLWLEAGTSSMVVWIACWCEWSPDVARVRKWIADVRHNGVWFREEKETCHLNLLTSCYLVK